MKINWIRDLLVAFCVASFISIIVPLQTFLGNRSLYGFGLFELLTEAILLAMVLFVFSLIILVLLDKYCGVFGRLFQTCVMGLMICLYFESGILSIGIPPLNGELSSIAGNPYRTILDTLALMIIFSIFTCMHKFLFKVLHWIALGFIVITFLSLADVRPEENLLGTSKLSTGFVPQIDVVNSVRYSPTRNIFVFILDSVPAAVGNKIAEKKHGVSLLFPGFTVYRKNLAMHEMTKRGMPGLMTGQYLEKDQSAADYAMSMFGDDSLLIPYINNDCPAYFSAALFDYGYTNRRITNISDRSEFLEKRGSVFFRNSSDIPYLRLFDVIAFRLSPYICKSKILVNSIHRIGRPKVMGQAFREEYVYQVYANAGFSKENKTMLCVTHTDGAHCPISMDNDGNQFETPRFDSEAIEMATERVLKQLGSLFEYYRKIGIYDSATIVIMADHGNGEYYNNKYTSTEHGASSSILWIKPAHQNGLLTFSDIPSSNRCISQLIKKSLDNDLTNKEINAIVDCGDRRRFVAKYGKTWYSFGKFLFYYEWIFDRENKVIEHNNLGVFKAN